MKDQEISADRSSRTRRRVIALVSGAGLTVTLLAIAFVFAMSAGAARIAENAQALHWANATAGTAALARAATAQAVVFGIDHELGVAGIEARDAAATEAVLALDAVETWARNADGVSGGLRDEIEPALTLIDAFVVSGRKTVELVQAGDAAAASTLRTGEVESTYGALASSLIAVQDVISGRIDNTERMAGALGVVTQILATLLIPAAAIIAYWVLVRRQYREERLRMDANLEAERELGRAKDEFIAGISHELRTPLTGIYGFSEYLIEQGILDPAEALELLGHINHEAAELGRMVEDLLTAARLDSEALSFDPSAVDMTAMVREVVAPLERAGHVVYVDGGSATAYSDPTRSRQIVRNLVSNAIKHGGDQIRITIHENDDEVVLTIADDGPGVPDSVKERLFDRFVHEGKDTLLTGSVGLGLSIARALAEHMGGDVSYVRAVGWTNFLLTLPLAEGSVLAEDEEDDLPAILRLAPSASHDETTLRVASMHATSSYFDADDLLATASAPDFVVRFD